MHNLKFSTRRIFALILMVACGPVFGTQAGENLLFSLPKGYKQVGQKQDKDVIIRTYRLENETDTTWTELLVISILPGRKNLTAEQAAGSLVKTYAQNCDGGTAGKISNGSSRGYSLASVLMRCPFNRKTSRPEASFMKIVRGADALYVVQKIVNADLTPQLELKTWTSLAGVSACDMRLKDRSCPELVNGAAAGDAVSADELKVYRNEVNSAVRKNFSRFETCYINAARSNPQLAGRLDVHWLVDSSGTANHVEINEQTSTINDPGLKNCVIDELNHFSFPQNRFDKAVEVVNFPFNFRARK